MFVVALALLALRFLSTVASCGSLDRSRIGAGAVLAAALSIGGTPTTAGTVLINNGLGPANPENVIDADNSFPEDSVNVQNVECDATVEYQNKLAALEEDLPHRRGHLEGLGSHIGWASLEDVAGLLAAAMASTSRASISTCRAPRWQVRRVLLVPFPQR